MPLSRSEEYLTRISTELTNEALFIAGYNMSPEPLNQKQTQDQETQISRQGDPHYVTTGSGMFPYPCFLTSPCPPMAFLGIC